MAKPDVQRLLSIYNSGSLFLLEDRATISSVLGDHGVDDSVVPAAMEEFRLHHTLSEPFSDYDPEPFYRLGAKALSEAEDEDGYRKAYWHLFAAATRGHADALFHLGLMSDGWYDDCPFYSAKNAVTFYRHAVEKGHAGAKYRLGLLVRSGDCVPKDLKEEADLLAEADAYDHIFPLSEEGPGGADYARGRSEYLADGGDKDDALALLEKAACEGSVPASYALGIILQDTDQGHAEHHLRRAADAGDAEAMMQLAVFLMRYKDGEGAVEEMRKAADAGDPVAKGIVGKMDKGDPL